MPILKTIKVRVGLSLPLSERANSAWVKPEAEIEIVMEPGDTREDVFDKAWNTCHDEINKQIGILARKKIVDIEEGD